jgi:purine nucleosidase
MKEVRRMNGQIIPTAKLLEKLDFPKGKIRMVLDTDAYNEVDDQFAIAYALKSPDRLQVEAIYAAPFLNKRSTGAGDGMEKSYDEILRVLEQMGVASEGFVYRGATDFIVDAGGPVRSEAVDDLIRRAMSSPEGDPLYVVAIGAITNVASAIMLEPAIIEHIVVVWLGGHAMHWKDTKEFNLKQDVPSVRIVLDSGVPLVLIPCMGVTSHLLTTLVEIKANMGNAGGIGSFLTGRVEDYTDDHFGYSKVIWDIAAIACLLDERFFESSLIASPIVTDQMTWSFDSSRHFVRCLTFVHRDRIFRDLFTKLNQS